MSKLVFSLLGIFFVIQSFASERPYTRNDAFEYFSSSDNMYLAVKIGGKLSFSEFERMVGKYNKFDKKTKYEFFKKSSGESLDKFLVLKSYRGDYPVGSIFFAKQSGSYTEIGKEYFLFFEDSEGPPSYGSCDAIEARNISRKIVENPEDIMRRISRSKLTPCLYKVSYD